MSDEGLIETKEGTGERSSGRAFRWIAVGLRWGRVAGFTAIVGLGLIFGSIGVVRGSAGERSVKLGRDLAQLADVLHGAHRVTLNGETLYVASEVTKESPKAILDRFERYCLTHTGGLKEQFEAVPKETQEKLAHDAPQAWSLRMGVIRQEDEKTGEGTVMCIAQDGGNGVQTLIRKFASFADSGELADIGEFRHAYVRPTEGGGSHVLTSFTHGSFNVRKVFSEEGVESPAGIDPPNTPRPPGAYRLVSATVDDAPFGVQIFKSPQQPDEIGRFYDDELPKMGWTKMVGQMELSGQVWQRHGVTMMVNAVPGLGDEKTTVTFAEGRTTDAQPEVTR